MKERDTKRRIYPRVQKIFIPTSIEQFNDPQEENLRNRSLTSYFFRTASIKSDGQPILDFSEFEGSQAPVHIAKEIILVDSLNTNLKTKIKLLAYRLWVSDASYEPIKTYLPEGLIRLDDISQIIDEVMMDEGELGEMYELIDNVAIITGNLLLPTGVRYLEKYKIMVDVVKNKILKGKDKDKPLDREEIMEEYTHRESEFLNIRRRVSDKARLEKNRIRKIWNRELTPEELRVVQAIDMMRISFNDKKIIFGIIMYQRDGEVRARYLIDVTPEKFTEIYAQAMSDPTYLRMLYVFNILQRPNYFEVAVRKKQKKRHKEIAEELGLSEREVGEISKILITADIIQINPLGKSNAQKFRRLVEAVEREDSRRAENEPRKTEAGLARKFSVSIEAIQRARQRNRIKNREKPLSPSLSKKPNHELNVKRRKQVKEGIERGLTNQQISAEYNIPFNNVRFHRQKLRETGEVLAVNHGRDELKEKK